jgi:predicted MPP superfamily phosphohydrolase
MKIINVIVFISIVLAILGAANYYICLRGWQAIPKDPYIRIPYLAVFIFFAFSYIAGRILERHTICMASSILIWIGSIWFGMMLYLFLGAVLCDLLRFVNWMTHLMPPASLLYERVKLAAAVTVAALSALIVAGGYINTLHPHIKTLAMDIPKKAGNRACLDVALVTDIHLGTIISNFRLEQMVDMVNTIRPDIVLLAGDIVDEDLAPVIQNNLGGLLRSIRSRYGVYAVTGNHEYIGGVESACRYLRENGIIMLRDEAVLIDGCFYLIGREDRTISQFTGKRRKSLGEIMEGVDRRLPMILMDHQPLRLSDAAENGIDLQVSGHTHHGQLWPAGIITGMIYEISRGYKLISGTNVYVSSGYGTWGPPSRVGTVPEVVYIKLRFAR